MVQEFERYTRLDRPPDVLVIHAGGNDLGVRSTRELVSAVKCDFLALRVAFPGMIIVWSDIVARTSWRMARSVPRINKARIKVNKAIGKFVVNNGGLVVRHTELEVNVGMYLRGDGVHLTAVGIDLWALGLQDGIERALRVWRCP